jgi:hypothetical protein
MIILFIRIAQDIYFNVTGHYLDVDHFINSCSTSGANEISGVLYLLFLLCMFLYYLADAASNNILLGECSTMITVNSPINVSDVDGVDIPQCYSSSENVICRSFFYFC